MIWYKFTEIYPWWDPNYWKVIELKPVSVLQRDSVRRFPMKQRFTEHLWTAGGTE